MPSRLGPSRPAGPPGHDLVGVGPALRRATGPARDRLLARASGRVLVIGADPGGGLARCPAAVDHLDLCEPDAGRRRGLERQVAGASWPCTVAVHDVGPSGPFPGAAYDHVVVTLALCSVPDPGATAAALRAVLAGAGRVSYLEHVHAGGLRGRLQSALAPRWARLDGDCRLDRPATAALRGAGLVPVEQRWLRLPPPYFLALEGQAIHRVRPEVPPEGPPEAGIGGNGPAGRGS